MNSHLVGLALVLVTMMLLALVILPAKKCYEAGGLPVAGLGTVVCAQPFKK